MSINKRIATSWRHFSAGVVCWLLYWSPISATAQQSALRPASDHARGIEVLWWLMFYGGLLIFIAVMVLLFWGLWRGRYTSNANLSALASRNLVLAAGVAIPALILVVLVGGSLFLGRSIASEPPENALKVRVVGWMWWWQFQYFDESGELIATTANELHVPVGRAVEVELVAGDVIHSFWVPQLHGKTDLIPGQINHSWFIADEPGVFRGQCAEFCGAQHALMAFIVVAQTEPEFERWLFAQAQPAIPPQTAAAIRGQTVFLEHCAECHRVRGTDADGDIGPDLTHLASRRTLAAATIPNSRGHLAGWIGDPQAVKPENFMPRTRMAPNALNDLLTYLESLE